MQLVIPDVLANAECLWKDDIEDLLLKKKRLFCMTLVTEHEGLKGSQDWNCAKRTETPKKSNF